VITIRLRHEDDLVCTVLNPIIGDQAADDVEILARKILMDE
jgi:hypothetical protein